MANILEQLLNIVPSLVKQFGPTNPPGSSVFIALVALALSLSLTLLSRFLIDTKKLARYTRETREHNKMKMKALRTADKKLQLQVDRKARRAKKMQSELMSMRMRPLMFYFLPLMIIFFSMSSHYNFSPGLVLDTAEFTLNSSSSGPSDEDLQLLSHINGSQTYYNKTLRIMGRYNTSLNGDVWYNISGNDLINESGGWNGKAIQNGQWWTIEAHPKTRVEETQLQIRISLNSTVDNSSLAQEVIHVTVGNSETIRRIHVTSHTENMNYRQGEPILLFGIYRPKDKSRHVVQIDDENRADSYGQDLDQLYWNLTLESTDDSSIIVRLELFKINRSEKPLAAIFPFALPTKILWLRLGWNFSNGRTYFTPMFVWWYFAVNISFGAAMQKIAGLSPD